MSSFQVKSGIKSHLRKQPLPDSSEQNVVAILKSGDSVYGEFLFIRLGMVGSAFSWELLLLLASVLLLLLGSVVEA